MSYITPEGYERLHKELGLMKSVRRRELSREIEKARAHGDLRENAEYKAAKEAQALNEKRIAELEEKLTNSQILNDEKIPKDEALIGATIKVKDMDTDEVSEYTLVSELESDFAVGKISITSPIGLGLLGHKKNAIVKIQAPAGTLRYKILEIRR